MNPIRLATIAILAGALTGVAAFGQSPGYGPPPGSQPPYDDNRGYNDDRRYDDQRYGDRDYDDRYSPQMDVGFFYEELSPYGDWVYTRDLGWAWFPRNMHPYWRPYTDGRWVMTEYGWTWVSYEPFGWATYHYGRWGWDSRFGWLWVPGTIWGPAWVSWQHGGGYVGWAPLPPSVGFEIGIGLRLGGFNLSIGIRPDAYSFVPERRFLESRVSGYMVPTARNVTIIHNTTNITNYTYVDNRVVNRGVEVRSIEQATGKSLKRLRVAEAREKTRTEVAASEVRIFRPTKQKLDAVRVGVRANAGQRAEAPPAVKEVKEKEKDRTVVQRREVAPDVQVAPRVVRAPRPDAKKIEKQERSAQQELQRYQAQEKQKLEKLQVQEVAKARAQADRAKVEKNHQAEREAMQRQQRDAEQQLQARLKAQREAALAKPAGGAAAQSEKRAVATKQEKQAKAKAQQQLEEKQKQEKKQKQQEKKPKGQKPEPPPPA